MSHWIKVVCTNAMRKICFNSIVTSWGKFMIRLTNCHANIILSIAMSVFLRRGINVCKILRYQNQACCVSFRATAARRFHCWLCIEECWNINQIWLNMQKRLYCFAFVRKAFTLECAGPKLKHCTAVWYDEHFHHTAPALFLHWCTKLNAFPLSRACFTGCDCTRLSFFECSTYRTLASLARRLEHACWVHQLAFAHCIACTSLARLKLSTLHTNITRKSRLACISMFSVQVRYSK